MPHELSGSPSTPGLVGSLSSMAGIRGLSTSKVAGLGLQLRGKKLLSTAWTSLSPQAKAPKDALSSLKSWSSRKYEEMRESVVQSPAQVRAVLSFFFLTPCLRSHWRRTACPRPPRTPGDSPR